MSVEQRQFLGYAKVASEIKPISQCFELQNYVFSSQSFEEEDLSAFKVEWKAK
jgi:hypothetical protein